MSADPQAIDLAAPRSRFERASVQHADGTVIDLPLFTSHLLCDENGAYPAELNSWEKAVVEKEMARPGFVAWYRNPAQASQASLGISYRSEEHTSELQYLMRISSAVFCSHKQK